MKKTLSKFKKKANYGAQVVAVGALTGLFAGLVVTLFNRLVVLSEQFSRGYYGFFRENPAFIPLLFVALLAGAVIIGGALRFLPMLRGNGFPQTEGATRGLLRFKWYRELTGMFAASLFIVFMGLSAGAEGPSAFIGGACGYGVSDLTRRDPIVRRYQITGGACAGLAVVFNAPLTGIIFAYEEAHKRFTPEVFVCSFSSVAVAVVVRNLLHYAMGLSVGPFLSTFSFPGDPGLLFCAFILLAACVVTVVAVAFYHLAFLVRKYMAKLTRFKGMLRYAVPFVLAGVCGLVTVWAMGGGTEFIGALGSGSEGGVSVFGSPLWAAVLIVVMLKLVTTVANLGADLPCCASVPMFAMGAGIGKLLSLLFIEMGMDPALSDGVVVLCMVTFFTTVVKAPVTGIIMTVELTWSFSFLLPAVICAAVGYLVGDVLHTEPLYDRLLDDILEREKRSGERITVRVRVTAGSPAAGRAVRDILWPFTALVKSVERGSESFAPVGATELCAGDVLTVEGEPSDRKDFLAALAATVGEIMAESAPPVSPAPPVPPAPPESGNGEGGEAAPPEEGPQEK